MIYDDFLGGVFTDISILDFIQSHLRNPALDSLFVFMTGLGDNGLIWITAAVLMLCFKKSRRYAIVLLLCLGLTFLTGELIIKNIVCRLRPCIQYYDFIKDNMLIPVPTSYSFPSGHSGTSFASAFVILMFNKKLGVAAYILAVLIALSRMYLYVHYPTDVAAGIILGTLCTMAVFTVFKKFGRAL